MALNAPHTLVKLASVEADKAITCVETTEAQGSYSEACEGMHDVPYSNHQRRAVVWTGV